MTPDEIIELYEDHGEHVYVSPSRAERLCRDHGASLVEYLTEQGRAGIREGETFPAAWLLVWLGY